MTKILVIDNNMSKIEISKLLDKVGGCISVQETKILPFFNNVQDMIVESERKESNSMRSFLKNKKRRKR